MAFSQQEAKVFTIQRRRFSGKLGSVEGGREGW